MSWRQLQASLNETFLLSWSLVSKRLVNVKEDGMKAGTRHQITQQMQQQAVLQIAWCTINSVFLKVNFFCSFFFSYNLPILTQDKMGIATTCT